MKTETKRVLVILTGTFLIGFGAAALAQAEGLGDQFYLETVSETTMAQSGVSVADQIELGHQVCDTLDSGASFNQVVGALASGEWTGSDAGDIVFGSVYAYCDEYSSALAIWAQYA